MIDIYIALGRLIPIEHTNTDVTGVLPDTSLVSEADWLVMCKEAGGESKLLSALEVKEDLRDVEPEH